MFFKSRPYSLRKSRHVLKTYYAWFKKRGQTLTKELHDRMEQKLIRLDEALLAGDRKEADSLARQVENFKTTHVKKTPRDYIEWVIEVVIALVIALAVATVVRQMWFELYEIPTGSMRPTFKEKDRLTVSKTTFGINVPLQTKHFYFDPDLVERTGVVIFSADQLPISDTDGSYFWIFPAKKRYIKRMIGKPGDSLYFYGGQIYGVDRDGNPISELLNAPWMKGFDHVPFLSFEGSMSGTTPYQVEIRHINQPIGRLIFSPFGEISGEINNGKTWVKDKPAQQSEGKLQSFSDFYGMRNYAMARLLTKKELQETPDINKTGLADAPLYLELSHHPSLSNPKPLTQRTSMGIIPILNPYKTVIPLQQQHLDKLMDSMYTARFVVADGRGKRYDVNNYPFGRNHPSFKDVPNGTYEFYHGKPVQVNRFGITSTVPKDSPLNSHKPENVQKLFNLGIDINTMLQPTSANPNMFPHRYAYFRNGDLYVMGEPLLTKEDPTLKAFVEREKSKEERATPAKPYIPFQDYGPPVKEDNSFDVDFIRTFGITIPEKNYLVLGDNHAMSADSRVFGFVPEANLEGTPSLIIWPPGDRVGSPEQKAYPFFSLPRSIIWGIAAIVALIAYLIHRRNLNKPIVKK